MNQTDNERIKVLIAITQRGHGNELAEWMRKKGVGYQIKCIGRGTAPTEMMDILGMGSSEKSILVSMGRQSAVEAVVRSFTDNLSSMSRGLGIMMVLSPDAVGSLIAAILTRHTAGSSSDEQRNQKGDDYVMKNEHQHSLILIAVNQGYTDSVMQTARRAGATGGTIVRGRLASDDISEKFRGITLQSEKEIVAILAPDSIKERLMNDVNAEFGLRSEAQGVLCSIPVDKAFKI